MPAKLDRCVEKLMAQGIGNILINKCNANNTAIIVNKK